MTDPMTTTRDGDVLSEAQVDQMERDWIDAKQLPSYYVRAFLDSHRALQQRLDAAEQRAERLEDSLRLIRGVAYHDCAEEHIAAKLHNLANAALTEQERDDA